MDIPTDEFYLQSPALNHLVPSSPHLFHHAHSPYQNVPDIIDRQIHTRSRFAQDSQTNSQSSQPQRLPSTPIPSSFRINKESFEQVVPNCSPFPSSQASTKSNSIGVMVPDDEKPPLKKIVETKRKNRIILPKQAKGSQALNFIKNDDIFD